jgi:hypothetical protein
MLRARSSEGTMPSLPVSLVLMRDSDASGQAGFVADLYRSRKVAESLYYTREEMLSWAQSFGPEAALLTRKALDRLSHDASLPLVHVELPANSA